MLSVCDVNNISMMRCTMQPFFCLPTIKRGFFSSLDFKHGENTFKNYDSITVAFRSHGQRNLNRNQP